MFHDPVIAVLTADRPRLARRLLRSLTSDARTRAAVQIFDNGDSPKGRLEARSNARAIVTYRGRADRMELIEHLVRRGCHPRAVNFALCPPLDGLIGAGRNWILLRTAGRNVVSLDDDIVPMSLTHRRCRPMRGAVARLGWPLRHFGSVHAFRLSLRASMTSWLAGHRWLGQEVTISPDGVVSAAGAGRDAMTYTIAVTMNGVWGYDTMGWPTQLLFARGAERRALLRSRRRYRRAYMKCMGSRYVTGATVTVAPSCHSACFGVANRHMMPPFFPAFRAEDLVWATTLGRLGPYRSLVLPELVGHFPKPRRTRPRGSITANVRPRFLHLLNELLRSSDAGASRCETLGRAVMDWGSQPARDFRHAWTALWIARSRRVLGDACTILDAYGRRPSYWRRDVCKYATQLRRSLANARGALPVECDALTDNEQRWVHTQAMVRSFGQLLCEWPAMWSASKEMNRRWL